MKTYLSEAFQELKLINEEKFDLMNNTEVDAMKDFVDNREEVDYEEIIDPLATSEEELQDSYIGKVILDCSICQSKIYKNPDEVIINEEEELANIGDACPYCQSIDGYKVIGQVAEYCKDCEEEKSEPEDTIEETETSEEEVKEESEEKEEPVEESLSDYDKIQKVLNNSLTESDKPAATSIEDAQKWVDFDMEKYGRISLRTNRLIKKAGFQVIKDDHGDYEVVAGKFESCNEDLKEGFEKVDIETETEKMSMTAEENGKVTVTTEPKDASEPSDEVIAPVEAETEAEFKVETPEETSDEYIDVDFDDFDETSFDNLGESYLKRVYENVESYKTTAGSINQDTLKLEGIINFKSGKSAKTKFLFKPEKASKNGNVKFSGLNEQFAKGKKTFTLTGNVADKKLVTESLTYNYRGKDSKSGASKRIYGRVVNK